MAGPGAGQDPARLRAVVVGEALVDVVHGAGGGVSEHVGGSPLNVAYGLARLGADALLVTRLGDDAHGAAVREHLAGAGVRLSPGAVDALPTSVALARLDAEGRAAYEFDVRWELAPVELPADAHVLHTGSIATALEPGAAAVRDLLGAARGRVTVSYDPNVRPAFLPAPERARTQVEEIVALADVVKASDEDLAWLAPGEDVVEVARAWVALGPSLVVVTRGGDGAVAVTASGEVVTEPAPATAVVDTVGAGDAFSSGLLDGLALEGLLGADAAGRLRELGGPALRRVLARAVRSASSTCTRAGAVPPTREQLDAFGA
ncbi:carbohydrate kinase [Kineococcus sp. NUM-3379]